MFEIAVGFNFVGFPNFASSYGHLSSLNILILLIIGATSVVFLFFYVLVMDYIGYSVIRLVSGDLIISGGFDELSAKNGRICDATGLLFFLFSALFLFLVLI
ncbi:hypothetical protein [Photobacterium kishitanii]|uniref:Uncharacterized protein n=1 Tax=Photobacterium kishitanii TaxID=318456 RepID=A0A2T3KLG7_9GAMM|nr:hypothetical protein [Photobacterium kishitanii]PSV00558.1 hypothetical protein C9J27_05330 [Photobacterium kishitanii]